MSDDYNRKSIEAYVFYKCGNRNNIHCADIVNEAMELLKTRGILYIRQLDMIIDKYCCPPKNIIDGWYYKDTLIKEEIELLQ